MNGVIHTNTSDQTTSLGRELGSRLGAGDVIALFGDLGAGKTTLTRGIAQGLGVEDDVHSPTFTLIHEHRGKTPLYHVDLYRLASEEEVEDLGIEEYIYGGGLTVIEWADRMDAMLPPNRLDIELKMIGDTEREMRVQTDSDKIWTAIKDLVEDAGGRCWR